jgi:hypothetical protein
MTFESGKTKIECPFCHEKTIVVFRIPSHKEPVTSRISGGGKTMYKTVPEVYHFYSGCETCGKSKKQVRDAYEGKEKRTHKERLERLKKRGLPLVLDSNKQI